MIFDLAGASEKSRVTGGKIAPSCPLRVANHSAGFGSSCPLRGASHIISVNNTRVNVCCPLRDRKNNAEWELWDLGFYSWIENSGLGGD